MESRPVARQDALRPPLVAKVYFLVLFAAGFAQTHQDKSPVPRLQPGALSERELARGESHAYSIPLAAGQYLQITIEQRGIDVAVKLIEPDGQVILEMDAENYAQGAERVAMVAETAGDYRFEVRAATQALTPGRYRAAITALRTAATPDQNWAAAARSFGDAEQLRRQETAETLRQAAGKYTEAGSLWQLAEDRQAYFLALSRVAETRFVAGEFEPARALFEQLLTLARTAQDRRWEAIALSDLGLVASDLGEKQKALELCQQAVQIQQAGDDRRNLAATLNTLGASHVALGEPRKGLDHLLRALPLSREVGDRAREATLLNDIGVIYNRLGQRQRALDHLVQALDLGRALGERRDEAVTLNVIGVTLSNLGEYRQALEYLRQALAQRQEFGDQRGAASTLNNLGAVHEALGDHAQALAYYQQSLGFRRQLNDRAGVAAGLNNLGVLYIKTKEPGKALGPLNEALTLRRQSGNRSSEAIALHNLAWASGELGEWQKARDYYNQALQLRREVEDLLGEAITLAALARIEREGFNRLDQARALIEGALSFSESLRAELARQDRRMSSLAEQQINYEFYRDLLMEMHEREPGRGYDAEAVQASERARARGLLELLAEARAGIRQEVDPTLLERQEQLQSRISAKEQERMQLFSGSHTEDQRQAARKEIDELLARYQDLEAQIRQRSPRYAALTMPATLSLGQIQQLLDDDSCLLEYALGEQRSFLWVITPRALTSFVLPGRAEIDAAARRAYELLSSSHRRDRAVAAQRAAAEFSQMILGPAAGQLGRKRLLVVSDGALQYVPFAALPKPLQRGSDTPGLPETRPLILDHEIVSLPSASVLAALRGDTTGRPIAPRAVAVFADPVYQGDDPRVPGARVRTGLDGATAPGDEGGPSKTLTRSARESGVADFARLPFSRREADVIVSLAGREQSAQVTDFAANRQAVRSAGLEQYRIVHFATHGLLNNQHPELSGIVLSLVDERGRPQDGFLQAHEIYHLKLNAELVVLSACRTALGKEVRGEGLVGLARGFMYAGSARVLASLWDVKDEATAELMKRFYQQMLKSSRRPAAAWRAAQMSMWKEKRWTAPYYWAGFVLQGEWR